MKIELLFQYGYSNYLVLVLCSVLALNISSVMAILLAVLNLVITGLSVSTSPSKVLWPDFRPTDLEDALVFFNERQQRFGLISQEEL